MNINNYYTRQENFISNISFKYTINSTAHEMLIRLQLNYSKKSLIIFQL